MELIPYSQFAKLRLKQFVGKDVEVAKFDAWEWMGGFWVNEAVRGADFSRWEETPKETGGLAICLEEFPEQSARAVLDSLHLPLRLGMKLQEVYSVLGEPKEKDTFGEYVHDRQTDDFEIGSEHPYCLACTVHHDRGLIYVAVVRVDVLSRIRAKEAAFQKELRAAQAT